MLRNILAALGLLLVFTTFKADASCINPLTVDYSSDSMVYQLDADNYDIRDYGKDHLAHAIKMIRILVEEKLGCARTDINFGRGPWGKSRSKCLKVQPDADESLVCYVESNLGNFIVTWDSHTTVNFIFKRWD